MKNKKYKFSRFNYYQESKFSNSYLIYNSLKRNIVRVGIDDAKSVGIYENGPSSANITYQFHNEQLEKSLLENGLIVPLTYDEDYEAHLKYLEEVSAPVLGLTIVPTYRCNFRCPYCYQDHENSMIMHQDVQDSIIKFVKKHISNYTSVEISWFGGEPLLCIDMILRINAAVKKICNERFKTFKSSITTNGYCLTKTNFEKLLDVGVKRYFVTLDGLCVNHDKQRYLSNGGGSFETIIKNLQDISLISQTRKFIINIRSNISKTNIGNLNEYLSYMFERFSKDQRFAFFFRRVYDWGGDSIKNFEDNLLEDNGDLCIINELLETDYKMNYLEYFLDLTGSLVCYASKMNHFIVNPDGSINKCTCADTSGNNAVGNLSLSGQMNLNRSLIGQWCSQYTESSICNTCYFAGICLKSYCVSNNVMKNDCNCKCFIAKDTCGKLMLLIDKCDVNYGYIKDLYSKN